jgi:hypothetical protein
MLPRPFVLVVLFSFGRCADNSRLTRPSALKQATNPDSANESSASSTHLDSTLMSAPPTSQNPLSQANMLTANNGALTPGATGLSATGGSSAPNSMIGGMAGYGDTTNYDFFDPQNWMLDGLLDFNYNYVPALEGA